MRKISRTISGVTPIAVMTMPMECPGECVYCPTYPAAPRSYTIESPAVLRARKCGYQAKKQVAERLRVLEEMGHPTDKVELIVMGGTFLAYPSEYQYGFIKDCFDGLNGAESPNLEAAKQLNELAKHRCVGLCIETRPDWCGKEEIERMLEFGATRVELGVQTLDDEIYRLVRRGHKVEHVIRATQLLRDYGFKVHYHWMPGLPGSTPEKDLELSKKLFTDQPFRPDGLKLYPTLVVQGTELEKWYRTGRFQPYDLEEMVNLLIDIKSLVPKYVRISRVMRDIPPRFIVAGCRDSSLRAMLKKRMKELAIECRCIRCREYGHRLKERRKIGEPELKRLDYEASRGKEILLSFEDDRETLFGLLRMRVPFNHFQPIDGNSAVIRELHVFGPEVPLGSQSVLATQHKGIGKALLREAERIARDEFQLQRVMVLSGTGAKEYYRSEFECGSEASYMVKDCAKQKG